jgi:hypothetical protein
LILYVGGFDGNDGEGYVNELLAAARCVLAWALVRHVACKRDRYRQASGRSAEWFQRGR